LRVTARVEAPAPTATDSSATVRSAPGSVTVTRTDPEDGAVTARTSRAGEPSYTVDASTQVEAVPTDCTWTDALVTTSPLVDTGTACTGAKVAVPTDMRDATSPLITGRTTRVFNPDLPRSEVYELRTSVPKGCAAIMIDPNQETWSYAAETTEPSAPTGGWEGGTGTIDLTPVESRALPAPSPFSEKRVGRPIE
jgi:hypothetical protein